jgi:hypothetical protein
MQISKRHLDDGFEEKLLNILKLEIVLANKKEANHDYYYFIEKAFRDAFFDDLVKNRSISENDLEDLYLHIEKKFPFEYETKMRLSILFKDEKRIEKNLIMGICYNEILHVNTDLISIVQKYDSEIVDNCMYIQLSSSFKKRVELMSLNDLYEYADSIDDIFMKYSYLRLLISANYEYLAIDFDLVIASMQSVIVFLERDVSATLDIEALFWLVNAKITILPLLAEYSGDKIPNKSELFYNEIKKQIDDSSIKRRLGNKVYESLNNKLKLLNNMAYYSRLELAAKNIKNAYCDNSINDDFTLKELLRINYSWVLMALGEHGIAYKELSRKSDSINLFLINKDTETSFMNNLIISKALKNQKVNITDIKKISLLIGNFDFSNLEAYGKLSSDDKIVLNNLLVFMMELDDATAQGTLRKIISKEKNDYHLFYSMHNLILYDYLNDEHEEATNLISRIIVPKLLIQFEAEFRKFYGKIKESIQNKDSILNTYKERSDSFYNFKGYLLGGIERWFE